MTKLEQAARQALEALEELFHSNSTKVAVEKYNIAHNALREALAKQAEQEPVAYRSRWKNTNGQAITGWILHHNKPETPDVRQETESLYAAPVHQVDLTDDELLAIAKKFEDIDTSTGEYSEMDDKQLFIAVIRAVIAAYKEKNK